MYISKPRKKLRLRDTSPPLAEMSLMLWIKQSLEKHHHPTKKIVFAEPSTCVWNCAPELIGGRLWCCTAGRRSWEIPQTGHAEFNAPCNGNCLTLGAGGTARKLRNQTGKQRCHLSGTNCTVEENWGRRWVGRNKKGWDLLSKLGASTCPHKHCPKPPLRLYLALSRGTGASLRPGHHGDQCGKDVC